MRKIFLLLPIVVLLVFVSCQKEIDWGTSNGSGGGKLIKLRSMTGSDSTVVTYIYDANGRYGGEDLVGVSNGTTLDQTYRVNRNASGIITSTVLKSPAFVLAGIDSIVTIYYYNTATSHYTAGAFTMSVGGFSFTDSAVYTYDGSGRIASAAHWFVSGIIPTYEGLENQYTYSGDGLNLVTVNQLAATNPGDPLTSEAQTTNTFDAKTNPLMFKNEGVLLDRFGYYNANNGTKAVYSNTADPTQDFTYDITYKYNSAGTPDSSYQTKTPGSTVTASKFFYQ
jgi:hypothetical protein